MNLKQERKEKIKQKVNGDILKEGKLNEVPKTLRILLCEMNKEQARNLVFALN